MSTEPAGTRTPSATPADTYRRQLLMVWLVAVAAGLGALLADGAPTGLAVVDLLWRFAFAFVVTLAAAYSPRWAWVVTSGVAAAGAVGADAYVVAVALVVLVASIVVSITPRRNPVLGALVVAGAMQVLLRLPDLGPTGFTALLAAAACLPVLISAYRRVGRRVQRRVRRVGLGAAVALVIILVPVAIAAVVTWRSGTTATDESSAWLDAARQGDQEAVLGHLAAAATAFADAETATSAWYVAPARALPLVGPQLDAVSTVATNGRQIVEAATTAAEIADLQQLRIQGGRIDLPRLDALRGPIAEASARMAVARQELDALDSTWLLPVVQSRLDRFDAQVADASADAELASSALDVLPAMLGGDGTRRYLILFTSPAETRELGGFMGNWGELTAENGKLELTESGRAADLNLGAPPVPTDQVPVVDSTRFPARYLAYRPWTFWQNITGTPDFPTVSSMAAELYQRVSARTVDGVIAVDPFGLAALLELTGPIQVESLDMPLDADNVADFLLREQYVRFPERDERIDFLDDVSRVAFERLTEVDLPGPRRLGEVLGPTVEAGQIRFWGFDPATHGLLERLGVDGRLDPAPGDDSLLVTVANANPNKIDAYLYRAIDYDVALDPETGDVTAIATVTLRNEAPLDLSDYVLGNTVGSPDVPYGANRTFLSVYSPLSVVSATIDGAPLTVERQVEYGLNRAGAFVVVPPQGTSVVTFELRGAVDLSEGYRLDLRSPALVHPDRIEVAVRGPDGPIGPLEVVGRADLGGPGSPLSFELRGDVLVVADAATVRAQPATP
jgi:hypothetical protein